MITLLLTLTKEIIEIPNDNDYKTNDTVIISDDGAQEVAQILSMDDRTEAVTEAERQISILRLITENDKQKLEHAQKAVLDFSKKAQAIVEKAKLPMYIWDAALSLDEKLVTFFFQAKERVNFRELVQKLSQEFKKKVHLQQIGPRDRAKLRDGFGVCGRKLCCANFLEQFPSVTMEVARAQNLTYKSPEKISGQCGRLLCCLQYEVEAYKELGANFPAFGENVKFADGKKTGRVVSNDVINNIVKLQITDEDDTFVIAVPLDEISGKYKKMSEVDRDRLANKEEFEE
ncbi:MAG: regulatory iron-sulfur-containing complex subunit RicT [Patescibacteria group bacterium]|nr:regulatory iron-sulfur-containing complex subunit RicT [Patescibacteria group bacterium]